MSGKVRAAIIQLIRDVIPLQITGTVKSVDETDYTCVVSPSDGGPDYQGVRLNAAIGSDDSGMVSIPDVNSSVIISPLQHNDHAYFVSRFSKVKKWHIKTVAGKFIEIIETSGGKININGDQHGGIPKKSALEQFADDIKSAVGAGFTAVGSSTSASGPAGKTAFDTAITTAITTFKNTLQNPDVNHG